MKKSVSLASVLTVAVLAVGASARADESQDVTVKIKAPLDSSACTAAPPTVSVLTLTVDVSKAVFEAEKGQTADCASLIPGQPVELKLVDDSEPLEATEVEAESDDENEAELQAPVQAVDPTAKTLTLLGLVIDASNAEFEGDDDNDNEDAAQPIDLSQITVGQFVEVELDPAKLPALVATEVELKNFTNQVAVNLLDASGQPVNDATDDVAVTVTQNVLVKQSRGPGKPPRMVKKTVQQQLTTHGSFLLTGLAKGPATITVNRVASTGTSATRRVVPVLPNRSRSVTLRLHKTRS